MSSVFSSARLCRLNQLCLSVAAAVALAACGGSDDGGLNAPSPTPAPVPSPGPSPSPSPAPSPAPSPSPAPASNTPVARDDTATMHAGQPVTINVLANDTDADDDIDPATVRFVDPPRGATLSGDGRTLSVPGQGVWTVNAAGVVTFTPAAGFAGTPTEVEYTVADRRGNVSAPADIQITVAGAGGAAPADALVGRWVPLGCGNLDVGGTDSTYRYYHLYVKTGPDTLELRPNRFNYSGPSCSGARQMAQPENSLTATARLVVGAPEQYKGYTIYRVQHSPLGPGNVTDPYQRSYTFTPSGQVCLKARTANITTEDIVDDIESGSTGPTNCGTWERLN